MAFLSSKLSPKSYASFLFLLCDLVRSIRPSPEKGTEENLAAAMKYILKLCKDTSLKQTGGIQRPMLRWVLSEPLLYSVPRFSFSSVHGFEPASASDAEFGFGLARYLPFLYFIIP